LEHIWNRERASKQIEKDLFAVPLAFCLPGCSVEPAEVANLVVFPASGQAASIAGAALHVDGGISRHFLEHPSELATSFESS
jgi:NAD(P)-dependent dehydrogenase (short-subunit alcohol dehydrogenase family)